MSIDSAYQLLFTGVLTVIGLCMFAVMVKTVIGPRISDRLMTVNMISTLVTSSIAVLSGALSGEAYLIDVAIIYVLISFISVVVFTEVFINEFLTREAKKSKKEDK